MGGQVSQLDSYDVDAIYGCHLWNGKLGGNGRPIVWRGRTPVNAYKLTYEAAHGPVPDGQVVDHLCRRILCVNAEHLEAVTKQENEFRKRWGKRLRITTCPRGHDMKDAMVTPEGGRLCRACRKASTSK